VLDLDQIIELLRLLGVAAALARAVLAARPRREARCPRCSTGGVPLAEVQAGAYDPELPPAAGRGPQGCGTHGEERSAVSSQDDQPAR
jgi:hypothetical protein